MESREVVEKRALLAAMVVTALGFLLYVVSISTPYWMILTIPGGMQRTSYDGVTRLIIRHHTGLWRICRVELHNDTKPVIEGKSPRQ